MQNYRENQTVIQNLVLRAGQATAGRHRTHLRGSGTSRDPNFGSGGQLSTQGVKDIVWLRRAWEAWGMPFSLAWDPHPTFRRGTAAVPSKLLLGGDGPSAVPTGLSFLNGGGMRLRAGMTLVLLLWRTVRGPRWFNTSYSNSHFLTLALCQTQTKHLPLNVIL